MRIGRLSNPVPLVSSGEVGRRGDLAGRTPKILLGDAALFSTIRPRIVRAALAARCRVLGHRFTHPYGPDDYNDWAIYLRCKRCGKGHGTTPYQIAEKIVHCFGGPLHDRECCVRRNARSLNVPILNAVGRRCNTGRAPGFLSDEEFRRYFDQLK